MSDPSQPVPATDADTTSTRWVTVREASDLTGASVSVIRKWYRKGHVDSRMEPGPHGDQRLVDLAAVEERAAQTIAPRTDTGPAPEQPPPVPEGMAIVPVDAWERTVQSLTDAAERAGRLEAENEQLRAQLAGATAELERQARHEREAAEQQPQEPRRWWQRGKGA